MIEPGFYTWSHVSHMTSKYYPWFLHLGYPNLDINECLDGSWEIIQYLNSPVIPCLTKWQQVLGPMRNVEISFGFCQKYTQKLDITKRAFWAREEAKTKEVEDEHAAVNRHRLDSVEIAHTAITRNPSLMNRIAQNGLQEMDVGKIARHVPRSEIFKPSPIKGERIAPIGSTEDAANDTSNDAGISNRCESAN